MKCRRRPRGAAQVVGRVGRGGHGPAAIRRVPIVEQALGAPNHEAEHGEAEEYGLEVFSEDPVEGLAVEANAKDFKTVLTEAA